MANNNNMRRTHSSPGVYFSESEITYASKSLGITTLGVAGETLRGPAFQAITIENWRQYQNYFGGTSTEKYRGSQYPKYELPYIAKSYLEQSQQLEVVRVLGLSGVNAGPAWVITATKNKLGEGLVYDKLTYAPTDMSESDWVMSGDKRNSFAKGEKLPEYITNPTNSSPTYYRQIVDFLRPEVEDEKCENIESNRVFDSLDKMFADTSIICGYTQLVMGYEYGNPSSTWQGTGTEPTWDDTNSFCQLPSFVPTLTSPDYLRIGCNCGYTETEEPTGTITWNPYENWFDNISAVEGEFDCSAHNIGDYARVTSYEMPKVSIPTMINEKPSGTGYDGDIVMDGTTVYSWNSENETYDEYGTISELSSPIYANCVYYFSFVFDSIVYVWNPDKENSAGYETFNSVDEITINIGNYISISDPGVDTNVTMTVYKWNDEEGKYDDFGTFVNDDENPYTTPIPAFQLNDEYIQEHSGKFFAYQLSENEYEYTVLKTEESYYEFEKQYTYYEKVEKRTCYEVIPVYNYFSKQTVTMQTSEQDTECCEDSLNTIICVLRSRGEHKKAKFVRTPNAEDRMNGICNDIYEYDGIEYYADSVELKPSNSLLLGDDCTPGYSSNSGDFSVDSTNYGRFTIHVHTIYDEDKYYSVSLNPGDKNYIYNVIGGNPEEGDAEIYVEELYDVALRQMIEDGQVNAINGEVLSYPEVYIRPTYQSVNDLLTVYAPTKSMLTKRYLYSSSIDAVKGLTVLYMGDNENVGGPAKVGYIYSVEKVDGEYRYVCHCHGYSEGNVIPSTKTEFITEFNYDEDVNDSHEFTNTVKVIADDMFYIVMRIDDTNSSTSTDVFPVTFDMNNYREPFRYSSTPWIISEIKGSAENVELTKLFRFHTISDGSNSFDEVKISIENIDPEYGTFDVIVRDFNDTDYSPSILEKYGKCDLVQGSKNYIAYRIGSFDGTYETKSRYITVEVNENDITEVSTPAGFMGYPVRDYSGVGIIDDTTMPFKPKKPWFKYNTSIDEDVRAKKQYFGVSDLVGIDTDVLKYKGVEAYNGIPSGLTACFHLDARILNGTPNDEGIISAYGVDQKVTIDGVGGYSWVTVGMNNVTEYGIEPRIGDEATMRGTIYEDKKYRKFTVAMYGGFDGWDYYRTSRSNTNDFTYSNYRGALNKTSGFGNVVNVLQEPEAFGLDLGSKCLNTDYYAYLGAIKQFANPRTIDINILATPGIDYVNNGLLVDDVIEMVEEERADALYVVTTPDKPFGSSDSQSDMYTPDEAVYNLEDSDIDSNRVCTYYPWEKYYDEYNYQYIFLPITRDVVKSIAYTDNITYPWYAPAGWNRGNISGVSPKKKLKVNETDVLYDGRINYINSFAKEGDKIWGNKNLQIAESQLNRISTRRLLLRIKKLCDKACIGFIFDPNDASMAKSLKSALENVLSNIKSNRGIYDYRVEVDDSVEARDRLELPAVIYIKPTKLVEWIDIQAVVTPEAFQWV